MADVVNENFNFVETDAAKLYTTIVGSLMDEVGEPLYPGDERRIFADALVAVLIAVYNEFNDRMKQRTLRYARGAVLDALGQRYDLTRAEPAKASANFRFSVGTAQRENVIIPEGTRITTDGTIYFATDAVAVIQAGQLYVDVQATCTEGGAAYNGLAIGSVATLVDLIPYVTSVSNTTVTAGGDDGEPYTEEGDEKFRERIQLAPASQSTAGPEASYRFWAMSADPSIVDVAIDNPEGNIVNIYPLLDGGKIPGEDILQKVEDTCSAEDVRPMSDVVTAIAPTAVQFDVNIVYYTEVESESDTVAFVEGDGGAIDQYIAWQTEALDRDINPDKLRALILSPSCDGSSAPAVRVDVTAPTYKAVGKSEVAQFSGKLTVSHKVVTD